MADALRLVLMTFPQRWDGKGTITLNVVLLPTGDPLPSPLIGPSSPSFANAAPTFTVIVNKGLGTLPTSTGANTIALTPTIHSAPASPAATFALLQGAVTASGATLGTPPASAVKSIRKPLPPSYMAAGGGPPDGIFTTSDDEFGCAVRATPPVAIPKTPPKTVSWGQVISYALRQPILAVKLGLIYELSVMLPASDADAFATGGYISVTLAATDPWSVAAATHSDTIRTYAARIPPLTASSRPLFAAVEFPVDGLPGTLTDSAFQVADAYSDGFAKLVHNSQPANSAAAVGDGQLAPGSDLGIEIGWDDEQVVRWHNDQLALLTQRTAAGGLASAKQTPLGVQGYRVDVADVTPATPGGPFPAPLWQSLCRVTTTLPSELGTFTGDLCIEPVPAHPFSATALDAWLPRYFATWRGGSLCEPDPIPKALTTRSLPETASRTAVDLTTLLSYGHIYSFRVRLGDLSCGGPELGSSPVNPGPASIGTQVFQRLVPPKAPVVEQRDQNGKPIVAQPSVPSAPASLFVRRPNIVYPEILYTHLGDQAAWRDTIRATLVAHASSGASIAGLPDPDVAAVSIDVRVRHPLHDTGTEDGVFVTLYTTSRTLNPTAGPLPLATDPGTTVPIVFVDEPSIVKWSPTGQPLTGPLLIPRGRDVQITVRALLRTDEPGYFGPQASKTMATTILVRVEPAEEPLLLGQADAAESVTGYLFRRPADVAAPSLVSQLAEELGVMANGNALSTPPGTRTVFGASLALRALISADGETLTFGSTSELLRHWIVAIVLDLERDWTWDGLTNAGFTILRGGPTDGEAAAKAVGAVTVPRVVGSMATTKPSDLARARTRLIFLDAIDPHEPVAGGFPQSLRHRWFVKPNRRPAGPPLPPTPPMPVYVTPPAPLTGTDYADAPLDLRLPIAIPPKQVPAIASVGLALSPYVAGPLYASTSARQRSLWIELTEAVDNSEGDALFARVLAHGADPLLYNATPQTPADTNPPLPLDPELVRAIIPDDTDDRAGLTAMTRLEPSADSPVHFLLPLPPGLDPDDPELFGFWTYELRIGHAGAPSDLRWWSTANARFGSPLRVVGVQHPPPGLTCNAGRLNIPPASAAAVLAAITAPACPFRVEQVMPPLVPAAPTASGPASLVVATASYATPMLNGKHLAGFQEPPHTSMWFLLYAQAVQADGATMRNVLIATEPGVFANRALGTIDRALEPYFATLARNSLTSLNRTAVAAFHQAQVESILASIHLPASSSLSIIAVELLPGGTRNDIGNPLGVATSAVASSGNARFPFGRILRTSPLEPVAPVC